MRTNAQVIQAWIIGEAYETPCLAHDPDARPRDIRNRSLTASGDTLFSYHAPIVRLIPRQSDGAIVALYTADYHSHTTQTHVSRARRALHAAGVTGDRQYECVELYPTHPEDHGRNIKHMHWRADQARDRARRARKPNTLNLWQMESQAWRVAAETYWRTFVQPTRPDAASASEPAAVPPALPATERPI